MTEDSGTDGDFSGYFCGGSDAVPAEITGRATFSLKHETAVREHAVHVSAILNLHFV